MMTSSNQLYTVFIIIFSSSIIINAAPNDLQADACSAERITMCVQGLSKYQGSTNLVNMHGNRTAVKIICREVDESMTCLKDIVTRCSQGEDTSQFDIIVGTVQNLLDKFCNNKITKEQLEANKCFERHMVEYQEKCHSKAQINLSNLQQSSDTQSAVANACRIYNEFKTCTRDVLMRRCGPEAVSYVEGEVFAPLAKLKLLKHCEDGSGTSSANTASCDLSSIIGCAKVLSEVQNVALVYSESFYRNKTAVDHLCRNIDEAIVCGNSYKDRCGAPDGEKKLVLTLIGTMDKNMKDYCNYKLSVEDLKSVRCIQTKLQVMQQSCPSVTKMIPIAGDHGADSENCKNFEKFKECSKREISKSCGKHSVKFVEQHIFEPVDTSGLLKNCQTSGAIGIHKSTPYLTFVSLLPFAMVVFRY